MAKGIAGIKVRGFPKVKRKKGYLYFLDAEGFLRKVLKKQHRR